MAIKLLPRRLMGQTIRGIRNRLGMSQAEFADSLGVESGSTVARWERGQAQPDYGTLAKIATMGLVDVLVFHETLPAEEMPQLTPGEAGELREILGRMEAMMSDARAIVERAMNRTAVDILEAASSAPAPATADALVLDAELRVETRPRTRSRTAAASRRTSTRPSTTARSRSGGETRTGAASGTSSDSSSGANGGSSAKGGRSRSGSSGGRRSSSARRGSGSTSGASA
jgi:transcriptional regulator with XRE-family HTH domain